MAQDYTKLQILIRDDGSSDGTWQLLQRYADHHRHIHITKGPNLGAAQSFLRLVEHASPHADYMAFSDQDDVWNPDKVSTAISQLEAHNNKNSPILYCSRVTMTDTALNPVRPSDLPKRGLSFANALVETSVHGCTMVFNRQLGKFLLDQLPRYCSMHDSWVYLLATAFGDVIYDPKPSMLFRRHHHNTSSIPLNTFARVRVQWQRIRSRGADRPRVRQAEEFYRLYGTLLSNDLEKMIKQFLVSRESLSKRLKYVINTPLYHQSFLGNLLLKGLLVLDRVPD